MRFPDLAAWFMIRHRRRRFNLPGAAAVMALLAIGLAQSCRSTQLSERPPLTSHKEVPVGPDVRIRIARQIDHAIIAGAREVSVRPSGLSAASAVKLPTPVTIRLTETDFRAVDALSHETVLDRSASLLIEPVGDSTLSVNAALLPGKLSLYPARDVSPGLFDIVETTSVEEYLPGVLAKELYVTWLPAAYEAQAVAARSYAIQERGRSRTAGACFDLESTTEDQAYAGATTNRRALDAVKKTQGLILTDSGKPLRAYYSSTCGGRAGSAKDTWPIGPGYEFNLAEPIQAHERDCPCAFSPVYRWTVTRPTDQLIKRIQAFAKDQGMAIRNIDSLAKVEVIQFNPVGRPSRYRLTNKQGKWWELSAEQLRVACNYTGTTGLAEPTRALRVSSGDIEVKVEGATTTIAGRGFGHGVGLCQFGAEGLARQGADSSTILMRYYPGARIEHAY